MEELSFYIKKIIDNRGKTPPVQKNGIPLIETASIIGDSIQIDYSKITKYISQEVYLNWFRNGHPEDEDLLIALVGSNMGNLCIYNKFDFGAIAQNLVAIRLDKEKCIPKFIYYYLSSKKVQEKLKNFNRGSAQPNLKVSDLKKLRIPIYSLKKQNKIALILSLLDEKIELNRKINQNLEEIAQTLFKRWFIDFEFPNEEGKPYKSSGGKMIESEVGKIPEGWRVGKLGEIVKIKNGYSYKGKELMQSENAMLTIKNFNRDGSFKIDGYKEISLGEKVKESHYVEIGDILVAHTDLTQGAEIIGNPIMVFSKANYKKIIMSMDLVKVEAKYKNFIYFLLKDKRFKNHALGYINGTTVLHLNKNCISEYKFVLPIENKLIEKLEKYLQKINLQICINQKETEKLIELRDYLLPRLMSGEISV